MQIAPQSRRDTLKWLAAMATSLGAGTALAQTYPAKPVRVLVGAAAGGPSDFLARLYNEAAGAALGQSFVVDNKPGASGTLAAEMAARASADGYTLTAAGPASMVVAPHIFNKLGYNTQTDFLPIAMLGAGAFVLVVHPSVPARTMPELIAHAKAHPGALSFGSGGNGSSGHLCAESIAARAGIKMAHIPYKGDALAANDLLGGQIQLMATAPNVALPHIKSGRLRCLGVTTRERMGALPDIPSLHESGMTDFEYLGWIGLYAPAATPAATLDTLAAVWTKALAQPAVRAKLEQLGMFPPARYASRESFAAFLKTEVERTTALIKSLDIQPT